VVACPAPAEINGVAVKAANIALADEVGAVFVASEVADVAAEAALAELIAENAFRDAVKGGMLVLAAYRKVKILSHVNTQGARRGVSVTKLVR
jgi:regulator of RNase E activity RraA